MCPPVPIAAQPPVVRTCTNSTSQIAGRTVQRNLQHNQDSRDLSAVARASQGRGFGAILHQTAVSTLSAVIKQEKPARVSQERAGAAWKQQNHHSPPT